MEDRIITSTYTTDDEDIEVSLRPRSLDEYVGQKHLVGSGAILRKMIDGGRISSFILWGPPGVGKTTLAQIIAHKLDTPFYTLSAVTSGVKVTGVHSAYTATAIPRP